jgi:hypothetical protein
MQENVGGGRTPGITRRAFNFDTAKFSMTF